ncbi:hypothetical protein V6N13_002422 [Hibiscus sabdariffa]|uniref:Uncharacterized protein n=1 Tax=Hibiscus sabdariffa TaxID=183260 RepID=A0ABR2C2T3_9ROSI
MSHVMLKVFDKYAAPFKRTDIGLWGANDISGKLVTYEIAEVASSMNESIYPAFISSLESSILPVISAFFLPKQKPL